MKLPQKVKIKSTDSEELKKVKKTLNDLLDFHYHVHDTKPQLHFKPRYFTRDKKALSPKSKALKKELFKQDQGKEFSMQSDADKLIVGGGGC